MCEKCKSMHLQACAWLDSDCTLRGSYAHVLRRVLSGTQKLSYIRLQRGCIQAWRAYLKTSQAHRRIPQPSLSHLQVVITNTAYENGTKRTYANPLCNRRPSFVCCLLDRLDHILSYTASTCTCTGPDMACRLANMAKVLMLQHLVWQGNANR
jgi:hypothetical protein